MPYCMNCRHEYAEGVKECPDCGVELVTDRAIQHGWALPNDHYRMEAYKPAELAEFEDVVELELVESQLRAAGIPSVRRPKRIALYVPVSMQERAARIMQGEEQGTGPGGPTAEEETLSLSELHRIRLVCSDCDRELTVDLLKERVPSVCPSCGHRFDITSALPVLDRYADVMRMMENADFEIEVERPGEGAESET